MPELLAEPNYAILTGEFELALFSNDALDFVGNDGRKQTFYPDDTKGFFEFAMAHAFPKGRTSFGTALMPQTTANSWESLLFQNLNYEHQIKAYHKKDSNVEDRILGNVVAASYPQTPAGGFKVSPLNSLSAVPHIKGVASFAKLATAINKVVGEHLGGRHKYTVSMEVRYTPESSGLTVATNGKPNINSATPDDLGKAGYDYWDWKDAPAELQDTFSLTQNRITKDYKGRQTSLMMGGYNGKVHLPGMGLVKYGAEHAAHIRQMAASGMPGLADAIAELPELLRQAFGLSESDKL